VEEFLAELKKKFRGEDDKSANMVKLKKAEQKSRIMEEFVQEFK